MPSDGKPVVVVTGFGPFGIHPVNASWVAVQELSKTGLDYPDVELVVYEIPVVYDTVKELIPNLWASHKPVLMVHVGVSGEAREFTLEQQANNEGYDRIDVSGCFPTSKKCVDDRCDSVIKSGIDMSKVCEEVNCEEEVAVVVSHNAGRYLCDFTYFQSLHINNSCSAFIHVPPLYTPYSPEQLGAGLNRCITSMLKQIL